jgi:16S rRNA processing protein RimM
MPPLLVVASIRRTHGLEGEVLADVVTDFPERLRPGLRVVWRAGASERPLTLRAVRPHAARVRLAFDGVETVDAARALAGGDLCVPEGDAVTAPEGYYYEHEVAGFRCVDGSGRDLGTVTGLEKSAAGPMLTVARGGRETLVPWTRPIVVEVDRAARRIVLDPPDGLFDL